MDLKTARKVLLFIYSISFLLAFSSLFMVYSHIYDGYSEFSFNIPGYLIMGYGGIEGLILIFMSIIFIIKMKPRQSLITGWIGISGIVFNLIPFMLSIYTSHAGIVFITFALIGFIITNVALFPFRKLYVLSRKNEVHNYILKLPANYDEMSVAQIAENVKLKRKHYFAIQRLVEDMIYHQEIKGKLINEVIYFDNNSKKQLITKRDNNIVDTLYQQELLCPYCKYQILDPRHYCPECGSQLSEIELMH